MDKLAEIIRDNISRILRYILPGLLIIGFMNISNPSILGWFKPEIGTHILLIFIIALVIGNVWYAFHRYGIHQFIDWIYYLCKVRGPIPNNGNNYANNLSDHIFKSFELMQNTPIGEYISLRASSMHLMYIASECCMLFSYINEPDTIFFKNNEKLFIVGLLGFIITVSQNYLTRNLDYSSIKKLE